MVKKVSKSRSGKGTQGKSSKSKGGKTPSTGTKQADPRHAISSKPKSSGSLTPEPYKTSVRSPRGISLDRKLDIVGVFLALLGILFTLSLLSPTKGALTGTLVHWLNLAFGWGMYIFPVLLVIGGLWLILRRFDNVPKIQTVNVIGFTLLYIDVLAIISFVDGQLAGVEYFERAALGKGGGYLGAAIASTLQATLGTIGTGIALFAFTLIALALSFDIGIYEILKSMGKVFIPIRRGLEKVWKGFQTWIAQKKVAASYNDLTPIDRTKIDTTAGNTNDNGMVINPETPGHKQPWVIPSIDQILDENPEVFHDAKADEQRAQLIEETLESFGAPVHVVEINRGPTITQFGVEPGFVENRTGRTRVRVGRIVSLADDLALALSARAIRIQAPVPSKSYVGIEVPNENATPVLLRDIMESEGFQKLKSPLRFALGKNVSGKAMTADLGEMPHLLIAGATGSGKSVCINSLICCLLMNNTPDDLRLILVDPKRVELTNYNGIPHLLTPVVVDLDKVVSVLQWVAREMDMRYQKFSDVSVRNIQEYNQGVPPEKKIPYLVVFIDELADMMMLAPVDTEKTITRLAQKARATGIHLVLATQRPSVEVITGQIKANFSARIAFAVSDMVNSRVILDQPGAERLLGRGDMLYQATDTPAPVRLQGVLVSNDEIDRLVEYWKALASNVLAPQGTENGGGNTLPNGPLKQLPMWYAEVDEEQDPLYKEAIAISRQQGRASISMLQRRLRIGYTRAARLVEKMEEKGIVGPPEPSTGTREILDYGSAAPPADN
jgi:S-DNA-T family DNA segregation ATPase FtsK/SpoIIIE